MPVQAFFIDVESHEANATQRRLGLMKDTVTVESDGKYREDHDYTRLYLETFWTEEQLDTWLYKTKGVGYVGIAETTLRG
jgi:hypothetical protein